MKWFKHDSNASQDVKLKKVFNKYKLEGLGLYWYCLELISQNIEKHNLTFELEHDAEIISIDVGLHQEKVEDMMCDFVEWGLFERTAGIITCLKMATRTDEYTQKLIKSQSIVPTLSQHSPDTLPIKSGLIEENRIEENRKNTKARFTPPTIEDITAYCKERKNNVDPVRFFNHYESNGWMVGKNKMKKWKACVHTWESNESATSVKKPKKFPPYKNANEWVDFAREEYGLEFNLGETTYDMGKRINKQLGVTA